jgi:esterase/lipase superfamily enzyme
MQKQAWTWTTPRLTAPARLARWGHFGTPVLIFPTAGGDFEEIERFHLIGALGGLIDQGKMKAYSVDGLAVRAWLSARVPSRDDARVLESYDSFLYEDVLRLIREDCQDPRIEPVLAGASLGASLALATLCRHPDVFRSAIAVSGLYDWDRSWLGSLTGQPLERLRRRPIVLGCGEGNYEDPSESRRVSEMLGAKGVSCRLSLWPTRDHTWSTWCEMVPRLLAESL